jgi:hypothetical protein
MNVNGINLRNKPKLNASIRKNSDILTPENVEISLTFTIEQLPVMNTAETERDSS